MKPALAEHHEAVTCYRRPGGECDKAGAKTRKQRNDLVYKLGRERRHQRYLERRDNHKTTSVANRVFTNRNYSPVAPRRATENPANVTNTDPGSVTVQTPTAPAKPNFFIKQWWDKAAATKTTNTVVKRPPTTGRT